jgi:hypothetical protein
VSKCALFDCGDNVGFIEQSLSQHRYLGMQLLYIIPAGAPFSVAESNRSPVPFWYRRSILRSVGVPNSVFIGPFFGKIRRKRSARLPSGRPTLKSITYGNTYGNPGLQTACTYGMFKTLNKMRAAICSLHVVVSG